MDPGPTTAFVRHSKMNGANFLSPNVLSTNFLSTGFLSESFLVGKRGEKGEISGYYESQLTRSGSLSGRGGHLKT